MMSSSIAGFASAVTSSQDAPSSGTFSSRTSPETARSGGDAKSLIGAPHRCAVRPDYAREMRQVAVILDILQLNGHAAVFQQRPVNVRVHRLVQARPNV